MTQKQVNPELYEFLKKNETILFLENKRVIGYVHIYFTDLKKFVKIIGNNHFDEGGLHTRMFEHTICVELNDIFESFDQDLSDYQNCFSEHDWNNYKTEIEEMLK